MKFKNKLTLTALEIFLWLISLIVLIPYALVILTSFKTSKEAGLFQLSLSSELHIIENYKVVFEKGRIFQGFYNSIFITALSVILILLCSVFLSFYIARVKSKVSSFLYLFFTMGMTAPITMVTTFQLLKYLGLIDTKPGVIFIYAGMLIPFANFIYVGFIKTVPIEMDEAAIIDGCGPYRLFIKIVLPLVKPASVTCLILIFMAVWNDAQTVLFFLGNSNEWTMPLNMYRFFSYFRTDWNYIFGSVFLTTLPVLIIYLFGQQYIIEGMTSGGIKG